MRLALPSLLKYVKFKGYEMKKMILTSLAALSLLAINAYAREYKCDDKDVIVAALKANPSSDGTPIPSLANKQYRRARFYKKYYDRLHGQF